MNRRNIAILVLLFGILLFEILIFAPEEIERRSDKKKAPPKADQVMAAQSMSDAYLVGTKGEGKEWEVWSKKAVQAKSNTDWELKEVRAKLYGENGVVYTVTGDKGLVNLERKDMHINGHVVTHSSNGYVFHTDGASYLSKLRKLISQSDVQMTGPPDETGERLEMTGNDLLADMNTNDIKVNHNVKARKRVKADKVANITSNSATFSGKTNMAIFTGNVVIDVDTLRITGPEARFNYKKGSDQIESMVVNGGVRVTDTDKVAVSQMVSVFFADDKYVFNGSPRVMQNGDELRGDQIVFVDGGKQVLVENARARVEPETMEKKK